MEDAKSLRSQTEAKNYDVVVVGGGTSGICAAIASARLGAKTALIQNRPVLGGNASSEIRMHICGALGLGHNRKNARETGIIEEILLENIARNPQHSFSIFDTILWEKTRFQDGLDLYLNTHVSELEQQDGRIFSVSGEQITTERYFSFKAPYFIDCSGDGILAYLSGGEYLKGREGKDRFGEQYAPDEADHYTMGNTLLFEATDMGKPVPYTKPDWAYSYSEEDLASRDMEDFSAGYWWIELGGGELDTIADGEQIRDELLKSVYGVWDHIKNSCCCQAENLALNWVGFLPGKRESRRVIGVYILTEEDLLSSRRFPDAVAYGGWPIDLHVPEGIRTQQAPNTFIHLSDVYTIPYRCLYARDVENLFLGGRAFSSSHVAFGSVRVMATCAVVGQAIGTAAALASREGVLPHAVDIGELQQQLLHDDAYIPGIQNQDPKDLARGAVIEASSELEKGAASNVINGWPRATETESNCWISKSLGEGPQSIILKPSAIVKGGKIDIRFDSDLSRENMLSLSHRVREEHYQGLAPVLVKNYSITLYSDGLKRYEHLVPENHLRRRVHVLPPGLGWDSVEIKVFSTYGDPYARIFEIRVYENHHSI